MPTHAGILLALCVVNLATALAVACRSARCNDRGVTYSGRVVLRLTVLSLLALPFVRYWPWALALQVPLLALAALSWRSRLSVERNHVSADTLLQQIEYDSDVRDCEIKLGENEGEESVACFVLRLPDGRVIDVKWFDLLPAWFAGVAPLLKLDPVAREAVARIHQRDLRKGYALVALLLVMNLGFWWSWIRSL